MEQTLSNNIVVDDEVIILTDKEEKRKKLLLTTHPNGKVIFKPLLGFGEATVFIDGNFERDITDYCSRLELF